MAKFRVVLSEVASYEIEVFAANEAAAEELAENIMATDGVARFTCEVHNRDVDLVEEIVPSAVQPD